MWALLHNNTVQFISEDVPNIDEIEPIESLRDEFSLVYFEPEEDFIEVGMDMDPETTTFSYQHIPNNTYMLKQSHALLSLSQLGLLSQVKAVLDNPGTEAKIKLTWVSNIEPNKERELIIDLRAILDMSVQDIEDMLKFIDTSN